MHKFALIFLFRIDNANKKVHNEFRKKVKRLTNELELGVIGVEIIYNTLTAIEYLEMHKLVNFYPYE